MKHLKGRMLLCLLLAVLTVASVLLCACSGEETENTSSQTVSRDPANEALVPHLGKKDWGGRTLNILAADGETMYMREPFAPNDELDGERVSAAIKTRNGMLEQEYGITLNTEFIEPFTPLMERVRMDKAANLWSYDVIVTGLTTMASLAMEEVFLDLNSLQDSHLNLKGDWWDIESNEDMTLMNRLFFATGDIMLLDNENTRCVFYNKQLLENNGLGSIAQLVYDKKWTLDAMYEMAKTVAKEGDDGEFGFRNKTTWGMVGVCFDHYSLVLGCDAPQINLDEQGMPYLAMLEQRNIRAYEKAHELMDDATVTAYKEAYYRWNDPEGDIVLQQFYDGNSLFLLEVVGAVNGEKMRSANIRYGIAPMPMYNEEQRHYATTINPYHFQVLGIVRNCTGENLDFVTFALEALAYTSKKYVTPEYYDVTLKSKRFQDDDDSPEMLDILFSNRLVDMSVAFNWDDCIQYYNQVGSKSGSNDLVSHIDSHRGAFEAAMNDTLDLMRNFEQ